MILDRELQLKLLTVLSDMYPFTYDFSKDFQDGSDDCDKAVANLYYLQSHGLITEKSIFVSKSIGGGRGRVQFGLSEITHTGMDFLANDGGLSAILGTVTIKFETEQLKAILATKIMSSDLSPERKTTMIDAIKELPAEGLKHLTTKIVDVGWDNLDSLMALIQGSLSL
ncbi:hypothetical protein E0H80_02185 [Acinetobacter sp. ANC 4779]|uniref:hypothetical protein n=1 Tax=Acinetobacter sp. ANC 4779 TaxID=2529848 RepID=UPI00103FE376|nr:hypothetical protein [Acinetobacter sp. ANC 4779]TCB52666.1 hypothetical protein E0H80_02185 [Acinetobacter sp. ANC 4779]